MNGHLWKTLSALALLLATTGCGYLGSARPFDATELDWNAVRDIPFVRQNSQKDCGAAALSMVLGYWGIQTPISEIVAGCVLQPEGIRAGDLRDYAKKKGLSAYLFEGKIEDLEKELSRGRPVVVGVVKPYAGKLILHYEVVVGLHRERRKILTLDPSSGWMCNTYEGFLMEWEATRRLTLVLFKVEATPVLPGRKD